MAPDDVRNMVSRPSSSRELSDQFRFPNVLSLGVARRLLTKLPSFLEYGEPRGTCGRLLGGCEGCLGCAPSFVSRP
jgi:hypothetical protein